MPETIVTRTEADVEAIRRKGNHKDSRSAGWFAVQRGSEVIRDIQRVSPRQETWLSLEDAEAGLNEQARQILKMRLEALARLKQAPHHAEGFRMSRYTGAEQPRAVAALCLISGHLGQEIPGLVGYDRVLVDVEHMEQALGPATVDEIFEIRKRVGEYVHISTNVSETPQIVRDLKTKRVDTRASAALTALKVLAALDAGADVVKVGFAHLDCYKRDLPRDEVVKQMKLVRQSVDQAVKKRALIMPLNLTGRYPLVSVFFPEVGIDSNGERPLEIAQKAIDATAEGGWQGVLMDTFEKHTGKTYKDFYSVSDTAELARGAHEKGIEFWIAGSITRDEIFDLVRSEVDLICFGGAARHATGERTTVQQGRRDESIKRPLVEGLVAEFERADPRKVEVARPAVRAAGAGKKS
jgi:uncharacterized protein (UPF0264 family)